MNQITRVLAEVEAGLRRIDEKSVDALVELLKPDRGVFVVGVGRVLLMLQAFAKRLNHFGIRATFVGEISEPPLVPGDVLIVGSGSGSSRIPLTIAERARQLGAHIVHIGAVTDSPMSAFADDFVCIPVSSRTASGAIPSEQPMTSLFEQSLLLLLDSVALRLWDDLTDAEKAAVAGQHANLE